MTLPRPCICLVTDRSRLPPPSPEALANLPALGALAERLTLAGQAGVDLLQIREPDLSAAELSALVRDVRTRLADAGAGAAARLIVNERVDVALAAEADGVHLKSDSIPTALVRRHVPAGFLVGRSVHSVDEARAAEADGADYVNIRHRLPVRLEAAGASNSRPECAGGCRAGGHGARPCHWRHLVEHRCRGRRSRGQRGRGHRTVLRCRGADGDLPGRPSRRWSGSATPSIVPEPRNPRPIGRNAAARVLHPG